MSSNSDNATALAENKVLILYILNLIDNDIRQDDLFKICLLYTSDAADEL